MVELDEKHYEDARIDFSKAVDLAPETPFYHRQLGIALYDSGKVALASQQFDVALHGDPRDATGYYWRAKALQAQGKKEKAIADLNTAIGLQPGYAEAYTELARIYSDTGQASRAARCWPSRRNLAHPPHPRETIPFCGHSPMPRDEGHTSFASLRMTAIVGWNWCV